MLSLIKPSKDATGALQEAGLSMDDFRTKSGKLKSVDQIFKLINQHTHDMSQADQGVFFKRVFGTTGVAAAQALAQSAGGIKANDDELTKLIHHIKSDENSDYIGRLAQQNMKSAQAQIEKLQQTAKAFELAIGAAVLPAVNKVGTTIAKWAVSKEGTRSMKEFSSLAGNIADKVAAHVPDMIKFSSGFVDGLKAGYHFIKPIVSGIGRIADLFDRADKGSHSLAQGLGRTVGFLTTIGVSLKVGKALFGGIFAIGKDTVKLAYNGVSAIRGGNAQQRSLNAALKEQNALLRESIGLQSKLSDTRKVADATGKNVDSTADVAGDIADAVTDNAGSSTRKATKELEGVTKVAAKEGEKAGHFWQRGLLGKIGGIGKAIKAKLDPRSYTELMGKAGDAAGDGLIKHLGRKIKNGGGKITRGIKSMFSLSDWNKRVGSWGDKLGAKFATSTGKSLLNHKGKIKFSALFKYGSEAAEKAGTDSGMGFARRFVAKLGDSRISSKSKWASFFKFGTSAAEDAGASGATGFIGKFSGALSKGATALGIGWSAAAAGIDIIKGIREHNPEDKQRDYGKGIGALVGGGLAGVFLGPEAAPIGAAIGSAIGGAIPKAVKWGQKIGSKVVSGMQSSIRNIQKGGWSGVAKNWNDFWGGMGDWFDKATGINQKPSKKKRKATVTDKVVESGTHVTKSSVANVKAMTKALKGYAGSLGKVKSELSKNDPTKELNKMNTFLVKNTKGWESAAEPIKKIGDAFKYLSKFAESVAKKDAFKAFNSDLPKLDKTLGDHSGSIKSGAEKLGKALAGKSGKGGILSIFKSLGDSSKTLNGKLKDLNKNLDTTAKDFKTIGKTLKDFTGKNNPITKMASGLDKLKTSLKNNTKDIDTYIKRISSTFRGKKGQKSFATLISDAEKPLSKMSGEFSSMGKNVPKIAKGVKEISKGIGSLSKGDKIKKVAGQFDTLKSHLKTDSGSISSSLKTINGALGGKKGFNARLNTAISETKKLKDNFSSFATSAKKLASSLKSANGSINKLASNKKGVDSITNAIKSLYSAINTYKFGSKFASQAKTAADSMVGKNSFKSRLASTASSAKKQTGYITKYASDMSKNIKGTIKSLNSSVVDTFKAMWESVRVNTVNELNKIIDDVNQAVDNINDSVGSMSDKKGKPKKASHVRLATGTNWRGSITSPTLAMLNDGTDSPETGNREGLLHANGTLEYLRGRNIYRMLYPGDEVINASDMAHISHFAKGTKAFNLAEQERISRNILNAVKEKLKADKEKRKEDAKEKRAEERAALKRQKENDKARKQILAAQAKIYNLQSKAQKSTTSYRSRKSSLSNRRTRLLSRVVTRGEDTQQKIARLQNQIALANYTLTQNGKTLKSTNLLQKEKKSKSSNSYYDKGSRFNASAGISSSLARLLNQGFSSARKAAAKREKEWQKAPKIYRKNEKNGEINIPISSKKAKNIDFSGKTVYLDSGYFSKSGKLTGKIVAVTRTWLKHYDEAQNKLLKKIGERNKKKKSSSRSGVQTSRTGRSYILRTSRNGNTYRDYNVSSSRRRTTSSRSLSSSISSLRSSTSKRSSSAVSVKSQSATINIKYSSVKNAQKAVNALKDSIKKLNKTKLKKLSIKLSGTKSVKKSIDKVKGWLKSIGSKETLKGISKASSRMKDFASDVHDYYKELKKNKFGKFIAKQAEEAVKALKGKGDFSKEFSSLVKKSDKEIKTLRKTTDKEFGSMWKDMEKEAKKGRTSLELSTSSYRRSNEKAWKSITHGTETIYNHFWVTMRKTAKSGLNNVIDTLNAGIRSIDRVVSQFGGKDNAVKTVSKISRYATGTGAFSGPRRAITKPTLALLNDGNDSPETGNKETIWDTKTNTFGVVQGRNTPFLLEPGQEVLNATESKLLGFTRFASGTGALKRLYELAKKYWKSPTKTGEDHFGSVRGLTGAINTLAKGANKLASGQGTTWWSQLWNMVKNKVDDDDLGPASGLLKAVEELGRNKHYDQNRRMSKFFADCSSLVSRALKSTYGADWAVPNGGALTVAGLWQHAHRIPRSEAKPGDPVFWLPNEHVGVYAGHGKYYSAYGPNVGGPVGMQSVAPGAVFARFDGLNTRGDNSKDGEDVKVKANTKLQKQIKDQVGQGFWKTIQKIADKYGESSAGNAVLSGDISHRALQLAKALKRADPHATAKGIAAIISNGIAESSLTPGITNGIGATGIWQFLGSRRAGLENWAKSHGGSYHNAGVQIDYALHGDSSRGLFKEILEGNGSPYDMAYRFSRQWEVGGNDSGHAAHAESLYRMLKSNGFANGGIADRASIFGEAGPEMAIPLSPNKQSRAWELVGKTISILAANNGGKASGNQSALERQQEDKDRQEEQEFRDAVILLLTQLVGKSDVAKITLQTPAGRALWSVIEPFQKQEMKSEITKLRRGLSGRR